MRSHFETWLYTLKPQVLLVTTDTNLSYNNCYRFWVLLLFQVLDDFLSDDDIKNLEILQISFVQLPSARG
jgi:hypothetical protein